LVCGGYYPIKSHQSLPLRQALRPKFHPFDLCLTFKIGPSSSPITIAIGALTQTGQLLPYVFTLLSR